MKLNITKSYLERESVNPERSTYWITSKGESVHDWFLNYCKRNKIQIEETTGEYVVTFKSKNQFNWFLIKASRFPYFEWL